MDYELAKQLKDAGLPQDMEFGQHYYYFWGRMKEPKVYVVDGEYSTYPDGWWVKIPTLEELIEACGVGGPVGFGLIQEYSEQDGTSWHAYVDYPELKTGDGPTIFKAVARLWLKLYGHDDK